MAADPTVRRAARERLTIRAATWAAIGAGFGGIAVIYWPIVWLGVMSLSARPLTGFAGPFTTVWYQRLFADPQWLAPLQTSLLIAILVSALCTVAATAVGRALPRLGRSGRFMLFCFMLVLFVPGMVLGVDFILFYRILLGIRTGLWSLVLAHFAWAFPFALLSVLVVTARFDIRLLEAAADLGAGPWRRFRDIEMPLLLPGIISAALSGFLLSFNELPRSIFLRGGITTLPLFEWSQAASHRTLVPLIYALSTILAVVSFFLTLILLKPLFSRDTSGDR